jgi:trk system potassium uptake protein TrkA
MKVIVVGCGRVGADLAYRLYKNGHEIAIIDNVGAAFNTLPSDFQGRTVEGDVLSQSVLHRAGIETADALAAVTNSDALNAVVSHVAKKIYHVKNVVTRNYDPHCRAMLEAFDLEIVGSTSWGAQRMEEVITRTGPEPVFSAGNGEVEIYEIRIPAKLAGRALREFTFPEAIPVAVTRAGRADMPNPDHVLAEDDVIHFSATADGIREIRARLD